MSLQKLHVARIKFDVETAIKDDAFNKKGKLRKQVRGPVAALLRYEAHRFIDAASPEDILANMEISVEDVEVEETVDPHEAQKLLTDGAKKSKEKPDASNS